MTHPKSPIAHRRSEDAVARVIRVAEEVLARAYRGASGREMIESQLRVRESVVREMRRRLGGDRSRAPR